jgi:hypothetical protein
MMGAMANPAPNEVWSEVVHFAVEANMSVQSAASTSFRSLLHTAFQGGFQRALQHPKADPETQFAEFCPQKRPTALRECFLQTGAADRRRLEEPLRENKFAAMTMDAGQIHTTRLFITNLVASHLNCCFTSGIHQLTASQNHHGLTMKLFVSFSPTIFPGWSIQRGFMCQLLSAMAPRIRPKPWTGRRTLHFKGPTTKIHYCLVFCSSPVNVIALIAHTGRCSVGQNSSHGSL